MLIVFTIVAYSFYSKFPQVMRVTRLFLFFRINKYEEKKEVIM